jgi:Tat protein translocase TatB subunit
VGSVGAPELIVIFLVALIVLGPDRLPKAARQLGKAMAEFKRISSGFQDEVRKAIDVDDTGAGASTPGSVPTPPGDNPYAGRQAAASSPDVDLPPPPDDPSRN